MTSKHLISVTSPEKPVLQNIGWSRGKRVRAVAQANHQAAVPDAAARLHARVPQRRDRPAGL